MTRTDTGLHPLVGRMIAGVVGALDLVGAADVAIVGFDALAGLEPVAQDLVEDLDVRPVAGGVGALDPHQVPPQDRDAQLVSQGGLPGVLVGPEWVSLNRQSLLGDTEVRPIDCHETVVADVPFFSTFEVDLWRRRQQ